MRWFGGRYSRWCIAVLVLLSLVYTIADWSTLASLRERLGDIETLGFLLAASEALFVLGAGAMAYSLSERLSDLAGERTWFQRLWFVRTHARFIADHVLRAKLFGIGFWLNFVGAVGSTAILVFGVVAVLPPAGWLVLLLLFGDLVATVSWRLAVHRRRSHKRRLRAIRVRRATLADIDQYVSLQQSRWQERNQASHEQLQSRFRAYPQGMMVAESAGRVIGMAYAMKIPAYNYASPPSWNDVTNRGLCDNHDPDGTILYGVDLSTAPGRGVLAGEKLLVALAQLAVVENMTCCMLGGRMPDYHRYSDTIEPAEYLTRRDGRGRYVDRQINYYAGITGLKIVQLLPDYFDDPESCDYGVLLRWSNPFHGLMLPRLWSRVFPLLFSLEAVVSSRRRGIRFSREALAGTD